MPRTILGRHDKSYESDYGHVSEGITGLLDRQNFANISSTFLLC